MMSSILRVRSGDTYAEVDGDDRRLIVTATKDDVLIDLTDTELTFMVKERRLDEDADALFSKTVGAGVTIADPQTGATLGKAYIELAPIDTFDLDGRYLWSLSAEDAVGHVTLGEGVFKVIGDLHIGVS